MPMRNLIRRLRGGGRARLQGTHVVYVNARGNTFDAVVRGIFVTQGPGADTLLGTSDDTFTDTGLNLDVYGTVVENVPLCNSMNATNCYIYREI